MSLHLEVKNLDNELDDLFERIHLITKYQKPYITNCLKRLAQKSVENVNVICQYIIAEQNEINLKESTKEGDVKKSKLYDFSEILDKTGEEERNGETLHTFEGLFGVGPDITYQITNATLKVGDKNPVLTIQGERS